MYMKIGEFRSTLKEQFDKAVRGEGVYIERGGVTFVLKADGRDTAPVVVNGTKPTESSYMGKQPLGANAGSNPVSRKPGALWPLTGGSLVEDGDDPTDPGTHKTQAAIFEPRFCKNGHPIPYPKDRCLGKGCKYS